MDNLLQKVRQALSDRNIQAVAKASGVSANTIYRIINDQHERGPMQANLYRLADYLGVSDGTAY